MNHKEYKAPAMDVVKLEMADIITQSVDPTANINNKPAAFSLFSKLRSDLDKGEMSDPFK